LKPVKGLKFGHLYACELCMRNWVLDGTGRTMTRVPDERLDILNKWNSTSLAIAPEQLRILDSIGGTALSYWIGQDRAVAIPCAISKSSGELFDPAIVLITERPPIDSFSSRIMLFDGIGTITPSRFALPLKVRKATITAKEIRMGFAPTRVKSADGTPFLLHWGTSLFVQDGITGSEIRLSRRPFRMDESVAATEPDTTHTTYFFADWFKGAEKLDKAKTERHSFSIIRAFQKKPI
jgi:hypothetical protein